MITDSSIAPVAALMAEPARVAMLWALADGRPRPAGELARSAGVSASTASGHLARLIAGELVIAERRGRHRYYRIGGERVVAALEVMGALARPAPVPGHARGGAARDVRHARSCYDHLAGALGVAVTRALVGRGTLIERDEQYELTRAGASFLAETLGIDVQRARSSRRQFARACFDWTERTHHLAGALGAALLTRLLELQWLERMSHSRALRVTATGRRALRATLDIDPLESRYPASAAP